MGQCGRRERVDEGRVGTRERDLEGVLVDDLGGRDARRDGREVGLVERTVEVLLEDLGVEGAAVVEGHAFAQRERVGEPVVADLPLGREVRLVGAVLRLRDEGVEDRAVDRVGVEARDALAVPHGRLGVREVGERAALDRRVGCRSDRRRRGAGSARRERERGGDRDHGGDYSEALHVRVLRSGVGLRRALGAGPGWGFVGRGFAFSAAVRGAARGRESPR